MAEHYRKTAKKRKRSTKKKHALHRLKTLMILFLCVTAGWFGLSLWHAAFTLQTNQPAASIAGEEFRPQVGDPPYRVAVDAGHGGADPGARGVIEEKNMTAATAAALIAWLEQDPNYLPLQTRESFDETATPAQRAAKVREQNPQLLLSIHGNSAANGSAASGFECYPTVPGRTWHNESFYFAQLLSKRMQSAGASLRGHEGIRYIYYLENDQKQLVESTHAEVRGERSFTLLEDVNCPAVLAEQCFVTSASDVMQFGSDEDCARTARIYYEAICEYFGTDPLSD